MSNANRLLSFRPSSPRPGKFLHRFSTGTGITIIAPLIVAVFVVGCASERQAPGKEQAANTPPSTPAAAPHPASTPSPSAAPAAPATARDELKDLAAKPSLPFEGEGWESVFDGQNLTGWRVTDFAGHGSVECRSGLMVFNMGDPFTGLNWTNDFPKNNYEVALDAVRLMGSDFFCGLTVPVGDSFCSLIVGGWGGSLVGISSLDGMDASENETTKFMNFEPKRWYRIRLRVTPSRLQAWIDQERLINVDITDKKISLRPGEIELSKPFGLASWQTSAAYREIKYRPVSGPAPGKS